MQKTGWLQTCKVIRIHRQIPRFMEAEVLHHESGKRLLVYQFALDPSQDYQTAWNDFYMNIDWMQQLDSCGYAPLYAYGEERDDAAGTHFFYVAMEWNREYVSWAEAFSGGRAQAFDTAYKKWMDLLQAVSELHHLHLYSGGLNRENVYIYTGREGHSPFFLPAFLLWRFEQTFLLASEPGESIYGPGTTRSYRQPADDALFLADLLFSLLFPGRERPADDMDIIQLQSECDPILFQVLYALVSFSKDHSLRGIQQLAAQYFSERIDGMLVTVGWDQERSSFFEAAGRAAWQETFREDTASRVYLLSRYDKRLGVPVLQVLGTRYRWELLLAGTTNPADYVMHRCEEVSMIRMESWKRMAKPSVLQWRFHEAKGEGEALFQTVKKETAFRRDQSRQKSQAWDKFQRWEEILKLQLALLQEEQRFAYSSWEATEDATQLVITLMTEVPPELGWEEGTEIMLSDGSHEYLAGTFIRQSGRELYVHLARDVNREALPSYGDCYPYVKSAQIQLARQRQVLQQFRTGTNVRQKVREQILDPQKAATKPAAQQHFFQRLNRDQESALQAALGADALFLLQGPPGTGKTTWITELILQIFRQNPASRILLASQSNVAIDHAFTRVIQLMDRHAGLFSARPRTVRVGNDKMSEDVRPWSLDSGVMAWIEQVEQQVNENIWTFIQNEYDADRYNRLMSIFYDWKNVLQQNESVKPLFLSQSPLLVGATCMGSFPFGKWGQRFDWVIIDEAGRATPPETLIPASLGKRVVLVGDHKQLPPVIDKAAEKIASAQDDRKMMETSLFEELFARVSDTNRATLSIQYRMHPAISDLVSRLFYEDTPLLGEKGEDQMAISEQSNPVLTWLNTDGQPEADEERQGTSYGNKAEVRMVSALLQQLDRQEAGTTAKKSVAVITGYAVQKNWIRNALSGLSLRHLEVEVDSVDAFQGREADLVIYSLVRNNREQKVGFLQEERRMNVTLSRAREKLFIVGSASMAKRLRPDSIIRIVYEQMAAHPMGYVLDGTEAEGWI
ncbi:AAA family ATPase [Brevibacillus composti]|uniref:AAA family ATPase n=1 Tax=Brevibacillus composti TaxID=2796470 RepID=A0A7T5EL75_9BACL|nr:AAA domain-containing protein [Brevibacillus composti]QQE74665.1 AAA family ATPase [Brevibacillus composti]QUO41749.1 AAA family ATPase [Brevibacillus composti]